MDARDIIQGKLKWTNNEQGKKAAETGNHKYVMD